MTGEPQNFVDSEKDMGIPGVNEMNDIRATCTDTNYLDKSLRKEPSFVKFNKQQPSPNHLIKPLLNDEKPMLISGLEKPSVSENKGFKNDVAPIVCTNEPGEQLPE